MNRERDAMLTRLPVLSCIKCHNDLPILRVQAVLELGHQTRQQIVRLVRNGCCCPCCWL